MGGPRRNMPTAKAKNFKETTKKLIKNYLSKYKVDQKYDQGPGVSN